MKAVRLYAVMAAVACVIAPTGFAQHMPGGGPRDFGYADMAKIFGKNDAFTATADMSVVDSQRPQPIEIQASYAFLKGNMRVEMDMASMKGTQIPPQAAAQMKQMGMDRMVNIYRSDKMLSYLVYPGQEAYCVMTPPSKQTDQPGAKAPKVDITPLGKETVDGHPCVKNKVTFTSDDGSQHDLTAWNATDLNDFPIKTEMQEGHTTITTNFRDVKLSAPAASEFDPPSNYKEYASIQEMMMANMQHMMPPGGPHGGNN
jgi:hypothetical protein